MKKYYLHDGTNQHGPYSLTELKRMFVRPDALVWYEGLSTWIPAGDLEELDNLFTPAHHVRAGYTEREVITSPPPYQVNPQEQTTTTSKKPFIIGGIVVFALAIASFFLFTNNKTEAANTFYKDSIENAKKLEAEKLEKERLAALEALAKKQRNYRNSWKRYVTHKINNYSVGTLGGINNLKVFATNKTDKVLDEVVVAIDYYKANGDILTTKEVSLNNIQPGSIRSADVEDTWRGTSIKTRISRITSQGLQFCFNEEYSGSTGISGDKKDPWLCK